MALRLTVVVSQSRSQNPQRRELEEQIVGGLLGERGIDVTVVPNLYDLPADGTGMLCLSGIAGDMVVCSWLFPRAARWILDRNTIRGQAGVSLLKSHGESDDDHDDHDGGDEETPDHLSADKTRVIDRLDFPARKIYCLDLRAYEVATVYLEEIRRIAGELRTPTVELASWINGSPKPEQLERYLASAGDNHGERGIGKGGNGEGGSRKAAAEASHDEVRFAATLASPANSRQPTASGPIVIDEDASRRWYPVIDFGRCTNCLECIDFCLFGVYGIDGQETILVEQPDNCRQGCPACSRVCPENAIIFPQHKTPTIAGSPEVGGNLKIDLSQLFGAPDPGAPGAATAAEVAARERDEQLLLAGRETVGYQADHQPGQAGGEVGQAGREVGIPKRQAVTRASGQPQDDLDRLIDSLDELDL